jgi:hypothetical protein
MQGPVIAIAIAIAEKKRRGLAGVLGKKTWEAFKRDLVTIIDGEFPRTRGTGGVGDGSVRRIVYKKKRQFFLFKKKERVWLGLI